MFFFLSVWNIEIYMHDIVKAEFSNCGTNPLNKILIPRKKGLSSEKDWPLHIGLSFK
jgi:hypothetical protein